jgi:hypothetical protein
MNAEDLKRVDKRMRKTNAQDKQSADLAMATACHRWARGLWGTLGFQVRQPNATHCIIALLRYYNT